jgi:hypothetical protein
MVISKLRLVILSQQVMDPDTILTPFSLSPMTDTVVDSLSELFLAYCTLADSDDVMTDDD